MAYMSNAVSRLHGRISRRLWRDVWQGFHESDVPIGHVTNGVHLMSYISPRMREVLDVYLGMDWSKNLSDKERWARVQEIPDLLLWRTRYELKQKLIDFLIDDISQYWSKYCFSKSWREELLSKVNTSALIIGIARRFAPYKRSDLLFSDLDRLDRLVNDKNRPVHIIISGKAHPNDELGKGLLKRVLDVCKDERFRGKIFFVEDYNIRIARHLVQGVDVWLNTPRRPFEASGTSGEKVVANGVLNLSISDGWWCEGYDGTNGWTIGPVVHDHPLERPDADEEDRQSLYSLLENTIVPLFYDRSAAGIPEKWLAMIKRSMQTLAPQFNTDRMLTEYYEKMYVPSALREKAMRADSFRMARELVDWKMKVPMRFSSMNILDVTIEGVFGDTMQVGQPIVVNARINPGKMEPEEILVELIIGRAEGGDFLDGPDKKRLELVSRGEDGIVTYSTGYEIKQNGSYAYGLRVAPYHRDLAFDYDGGLMLWG